MLNELKISAIKPYIVWVNHRNHLIVKVETSDGTYGWGESGLSGREKAVVGALEHYTPLLVGRDALKIGAIWQLLYRSQYFEGGRVLQAAISALDIALHDLKGKALGVPVYDLLGGRQRNEVKTFATVRLDNTEKALDQAKAFRKHGFNCIRLLPNFSDRETFEPREYLASTAAACITMRETLGSETVLGIDWHHRLSVAEAASFCNKLPSGTLDFLEEPIRDETPEAYEALRKMTNIPFAIGEEFSSKWQFLPYIERDIHQFNRLDICNVGGFTEAMKIAGWSEAHYVDMMPHNPLGPICTAASIHFAAAIPNFAWLEVMFPSDDHYGGMPDNDIFKEQPALNGTVYKVGQTPGLGIEIDEDAASQHDFRFWQPPTLKRRDGSVTNW